MVTISKYCTKNVLKLYSFSSLYKAYEIFKKFNISGIAVVNKENNVVGQIEKVDILKFVKKPTLEKITEKDFKKLKKTRVYKILKKAETVFENEDVEVAIKKMNENNLNRIFVVNKNKELVGVFSKSDVIKLKLSKEGVYTAVDYMVEIIKERKKIKLVELAKILNLPEDIVENWAKTLEEQGIVEIEYKTIGGTLIKLK